MRGEPIMRDSRHFGLVGGLGVGATVLYYQKIAAALAAKGLVPRLSMAHADAPTALAHVEAGRMDGLAEYLAGFVTALARAGAEIAALPAITPHICLAALKALSPLPLVDILETTAQRVAARGLGRIALFGTRFAIDRALFGALAAFEVVRPNDGEVAEIHRIYIELAQRGRCSAEDKARLVAIARDLVRRERVEAVLLAGTDLNLIFDEATAGFPAVDCAAAHIDAIVARMAA
jgi:aspartate racemase